MKEINIISFDVPFPANYGGVIDVFHKIRAFHKQGFKVHLHCFEYGRGKQVELEKFCTSVNYYKRKTGIGSQLSSLPYIVKSRTSNKLKTNLLKNDFPILFEGLHCCFLLDNDAFKNRFKIVRNHNIEHDYYNGLANIETNPIKRKYFKTEANKLKQFESIIKNADLCLTVSEADQNYFENKYKKNKFILASCFHANQSVKINSGNGNYVLYHGNLSVAENNNAAHFIIEQLFNDSEISLKIAGLNPSDELVNLVSNYSTIELIKNPSDKELFQLIHNAQINLLYTEQATGLKLKLLNVLFSGRQCIVNSKMVAGTSLKDLCFVEDDIHKLKGLIKNTFTKEISVQEIEKRSSILSNKFSNDGIMQKIIEAIPE